MTLRQKLRYLSSSALKTFRPETRVCPSCGRAGGPPVARKYLVTALRRCGHCGLLFRTPTTSEAENAAFYQEDYTQEMTTEMPGREHLDGMLRDSFVGTEKDYSSYLRLLEVLGCRPGDRLLDFGGSWGYGSWQFRKAGYQPVCYEISRPRAEYARRELGIDAYHRLEQLPEGGFDIFFSAHVFEHLPSVEKGFELAKSKLRKGGLFVAFTPNGSQAYRDRCPEGWQQLWGFLHPNFLDEAYYRRHFPRALLASRPYDLEALRKLVAQGAFPGSLSLAGDELMMAVRME